MSQALDVLIFGAHPDDAEIGMGGTIRKLVEQGKRVGIVDLTRAEMSSNGTVEIRLQEAVEASAILGLAVRDNLELPDRGLTGAADQIAKLVRTIRFYKPQTVLAPYWEDRHPDHVQCSKLVQEAVFNAKLRRYMPEQAAWTANSLYFYFINDIAKPDFIVDVSAVYPAKLNALKAYRSQFTAPSEDADYVETPLNRGYVERVEARDKALGQSHSIGYAEGFVTRIPLVLDTL
ncbi:bacillithiol biosynthesis deacetylase BshB1 [Xylanibacillus composti]|uniref:Bacillithiol biosynthesis deacetylase BshB1 n=1 Tax=Xylanibacillus composti TaxID=1572762 RepID=A0A8J4H118_9BACL|nr:bacillithiol biosynthesis deacetylase BshB1 [Xylanibacillus composti]MDT9725491.1 bacillithiol biosynthesis deacetylase BshB1 [Xylanibacillus composti]GIQ67585.1 bacillithiol biosynthesis deacetylase BshB1 [Xylanibacillus composti]